MSNANHQSKGLTPRSERERLPWGERVALNAREIAEELRRYREVTTGNK